jgi:hypothetical protein
MEFFEQWTNLENTKAKVLLKHSLFGRQIHNCDSVHIINDDRIGLILKGQEIFVSKLDVIQTEIRDGMHTVSDGKLTITIIMNKS